MSNYKVIYRADLVPDTANRIFWEPGCPLIFEAIQISRNIKSGEAYLQARLKNISSKKIESFQTDIKINYQDGTFEVITQHPLDADINCGDSYTLKDTLLRQGNVADAEAKVISVKSEDFSWASSDKTIEAPKPIPLDISKDATKERYYQLFQGSKVSLEAASNGIFEKDDWWVCPCGQINVDRETCLNCSSSVSVLKNKDLTNEEKLTDSFTKRMKTERGKAKKKKKRIVFALVGLIVFALIGIGAVCVYNYVIVPEQIYVEASSELSSAQYDEAYRKFESIKNYRDSNEKAQEAVYENALANLNDGQYEKAYGLFASLGDYKDAISKSQESKEALEAINFLVAKTDRSWIGSVPDTTKGVVDFSKLGIQFNSNLSCRVGFERRSIEWYLGTWSPLDKEIYLHNCPYGNTWKIENMEYEKLRNYEKKIQVESTELDIQITLRF